MPNLLSSPNGDVFKNDATNTNNVEDNGKFFLFFYMKLKIYTDLNKKKKKCYKIGEPGHGDELIFLYDVRTLDGKPISGTELKDKRDIEMRNIFTSIVAEFVRNG